MTDSLVTETAFRIFTDLADPQTLNRASVSASTAPLWRALEDAGLPLAWVPDDLGGAGANFAEGFEVARISGCFAAPVAVTETLLAGWLLAQAKIASPPGIMTVAPARPHDRLTLTSSGAVSGRARGVPFAREATHLAVIAHGANGPQIALLDTKSCQFGTSRALAGVSCADVVLAAVKPLKLAPAPKCFTQSHLMQMGATLRAIESAGALQAILELATQYARERVAFGKPIAKFQAVQHNLARLAGEASAAMIASGSAVDAIASIAADPARFDDAIFLEVASARIRSAEAATEGAAIAHQEFGAIGFTREHILHRYTLRLLSWRDDFGHESGWAVDLGKRIAAKGADELWPALAAR